MTKRDVLCYCCFCTVLQFDTANTSVNDNLINSILRQRTQKQKETVHTRVSECIEHVHVACQLAGLSHPSPSLCIVSTVLFGRPICSVCDADIERLSGLFCV